MPSLRGLTCLMVLALCGLALAAGSAAAASPPIITGVAPERAPVGWGPTGENDWVREITITGENLAEATVTSPIFSTGAPAEKEYEVKEDTSGSLVVLAPIGTQPGAQRLVVHTPGGAASTQVIYEPQAGVYPAIGRCTAAAGGKYKDKKCSKVAAAGKGKYEWAPGIAGGTVTFSAGATTLGGLDCSGASGSGTLAGASEVTDVVLTFAGCSIEGLGSCTSTGTAGEVETQPLLADLAWRSKGGPGSKAKLPELGLFPPVIEGDLATFTCAGHVAYVRGAAIGQLKAGSFAGSMPIDFEWKKSEPSLHGIEWVGWSIDTLPGIEFEERAYSPYEGPERLIGTVAMGAPEPFSLNTAL